MGRLGLSQSWAGSGWPPRRLRLLICGCAVAVTLLGSGVTATSALADVSSPPQRGALYFDGPTDRYLLGGTWLYRPDPADSGLTKGWWRDPSPDGWSPSSVPNAFNAGDLSNASMQGAVAWYRRDFQLPATASYGYAPQAATAWIVRFESVNYRATVWLNGQLLGSHAGGYLPFELRLQGVRPGLNTLVVRVDSRRGDSDVPPGPWGGWWNYGGLLREVYLRSVHGADLFSVRVRTLLRCPTCAATVQVRALVRNVEAGWQRVRLHGTFGGRPLSFGAARIAAGGVWAATAATVITRPRLWAPDHPALYRVGLALTDASGSPLAGYQTLSGIRHIAVVHGRLQLNWRWLHLRGLDLHEQDLRTGAALSPTQLQQLMLRIRSVGAELIRSHYPLNPQLLEMADRYGILVWSEIPLWRPSPEALSQPPLRRQAAAELSDSISANQNHPSILLWSIGNELRSPTGPPEARYIARASALVHRLDPTRPVGMAVNSWPGNTCQRAYAPLDVVGINEYVGWFDFGGGTTDDRDALGPFLDSLRRCYRRQAVLVSEFGVEANRPGPVEERGTYAFQANALAFHLGVYARKPWLSGAILWLLQDFAAWPGWDGGNPRGTPPFVQKGLFDLQGNPKPAEAVVAGIYHASRQIAPSARDWGPSR